MKKKTSMRAIIKYLLVVLALFMVLIATNTLSNSSIQMHVDRHKDIQLDQTRLTGLLSQAIQYKTVSLNEVEQIDFASYDAFRGFLKSSFPLTFEKLKVETINQHSLLLTWSGTTDEKPALFIAHYDVVPTSNQKAWSHPPFRGAVADGYIWGRGALDDKSAVITQLYAIEHLLAQGFQPKRTLLFAYGHDEEITGKYGAQATAKLLEQRGIRPSVIFDEGMPITKGVLKGINKPAALIAIAAKGHMILDLTVKGNGGHSSSPPPHSAVGILADAITKIENQPMPARISKPVAQMFDTLSPEMGFAQKAVLSNRWLFAPLLKKQLATKNSTNALIRTTAAATMFQGSPQANVLPTYATASINFRLIPGDTVESVTQYVKTIVDDPRIEISVRDNRSNPSDISSTQSEEYLAVTKTVREVFDETLTAPALLIGTTDARHYTHLADNAYRFRPLWVTQEDIKRFHGIDERISKDNLVKMAQFNIRLFENLN